MAESKLMLAVHLKGLDVECTMQAHGQTYNPTIASDVVSQALRGWREAVSVLYDEEDVEDAEAAILAALEDDAGADG